MKIRSRLHSVTSSARNLLFPHLLFKNVNIKIYVAIILLWCFEDMRLGFYNIK